MKTLSIPELHETFLNPKNGELILDVRTPGEFSQGHVPGSKNIPFDLVMNHAEELKTYQTVYIYCRSGGRAVTAFQILETLGLKNLSIVADGGFPDWVDAGYKSSSY